MTHSFRSLALAAALAAGFSVTAAATVKDGIDAWERGDYPAAVAEWKRFAATGDADAQFNLANAYKLGRGVPINLKAAVDLYRKAAVQGHEQAQAELGLLLFQNGDRPGAMPWIQKGAAHGDPRSEYVLGTALFNGDIVAKDWVRAYALMTRAAGAGLAPATASLEQMDGYLSDKEKQQGIVMARDLAAQAPPPIVATELPPSRPVRIAEAEAPVSTPATPVSHVKTPPPPHSVKPAIKPVATPTLSARPAPVAKPVKPAPAVRMAASPGGKWNVQLGAFGGVAPAQAEWARIKDKPGLAGLKSFTMAAGAFTRLRAGPLADRAAADRVCQAAKSAGAACIPVAP